MNSAIWNGLIPGGKSLKRGRQAVFFTTVNPMDHEKSMGETPRDLTKPRIAPYKNTWTRLQNNWESGMYENSRRALPKGSLDSKSATGCIQSEFRNTVNKTHQAKTQDHLETHQAIRSVTWKLVATSWITEFRVYLFLQSSSRIQHVRTRSEVDREVWEPPVQGILPSRLEPDAEDQQVQQRIVGFDRRHERHRDLRALRTLFQKTMPRLPYLLGNRHCQWQLWKKFENFAETSRGAKHGPSQRQRMYHKAQEMLQKARQEKHGSYSSIFARWNNGYEYRDSVSLVGWTEQDINAIWEHSYVAAEAERIRNSTHWVLTLNQEGPQQPLNQRPDFAQAKRECKRLHDEHLARTQQDCRTIPRSRQVRQRKEQQFEGIEEFDYAVAPKTGWRFYKESQGNLPTASSSSSHWDRNNWKTSSWNSKHSSWSDDSWFFSELGPVSVDWRKPSRQPAKSLNNTPTNTARAELHSTRTRVAQELEGSGLHIFVSKNNCHPRVMSHPLPHLTPSTIPSSLSLAAPIFPTIPPTRRPLAHDEYLPCDVPRQSGGSTQIPSLRQFTHLAC